MLQQRCPYIGLPSDPTSMFTEPTEEHRCHVGEGRQRIELAHQAAFCLTANYEVCPRFVPMPEPEPSSRSLASRLPGFLRGTPILLLAAWVTLAVVGILVILYAYVVRPLPTPVVPTEVPAVAVAPTGLPTLRPTETAQPPTPTALATPVLSTPAPAPPPATLVPGRLQAALVPAGNAVGWVFSGERLNHFGNRNIHAGVFEGQVYYGAVQFSLDSVPVGSRIEHGTVELMGLNAENLDPEADGTWALRLLVPEVDENWSSATYEQIRAAPVAETIAPELGARDLAVRQVTMFSLSGPQLRELERRVEGGLVSFRLDGPSQGDNNLFTWDTGYGEGFGTRPVLRVIYQPPPTPTPVVITVAPSPANVVTAAAMAAAATEQAEAMGTSTPLPPNIVTATPPFVVLDTPTPGNVATAEWVSAMATAQTFLYGTATPLSIEAWTATPVPTPTATPPPTATPTYVIVTVVAPENIVTVAAMVGAAGGTLTPFPPNWVTPVIVTRTPTPRNVATANHLMAVATARAFLFGTPTPLQSNVWTATPTAISTPVPLLILLDHMTPDPPTPTRTPTPSEFPAAITGKIAFRSDRLGGEHVLVMDSDGSNVALLTNTWVYEAALSQRSLSPDGRFLVYQGEGRRGVDLFLLDLLHGVHGQLTYAGDGTCYDAAWSPDNLHIAFASNQEGDDEIFAVTRDGGPTRQLTHNQWEWDKHPSYSPDGGRIVYCSNAGTGHMQIWVMNADGSAEHNISNSSHNDWDPVWIKQR